MGWVGENNEGRISNSYGTGAVSADGQTGGLVGYNSGTIISRYATGGVTARSSSVGGLVGEQPGNSHWLLCCGISIRAINCGRTDRVALRECHCKLLGYPGIRAEHRSGVGQFVRCHRPDHRTIAGADRLHWDLPGLGGSQGIGGWNVGASSQYPVLTADIDYDGRRTWREFGHQCGTTPPAPVTATRSGGAIGRRDCRSDCIDRSFTALPTGPNWRDGSNWLSELPVEDWIGVTINTEGRVTRLDPAEQHAEWIDHHRDQPSNQN